MNAARSTAPSIYELSFFAQLPPVPVTRVRLGLRGDGDPLAQLQVLTRQASRELDCWLAVDRRDTTDRELAIVYPENLNWPTLAATLEAIADRRQLAITRRDAETIPLRDWEHRRLLQQYCDRTLCQLFAASPASRVVAHRQRVYSERDIQTIGNEASVQRYLKFAFSRDRDGDLVLCIDYANEYRSLQTLDRLDLDRRPLKPGQRLTQTTDRRGCFWVDWADATATTPLPELGGLSLLDYHHQRGHLENANPIDLKQRAVLVRYPFQRDPVHHLPQLLKRIYDRRDLPAGEFDRHITPIDGKARLASQTIDWLNRRGFYLGQRLRFDPAPRPLERFTQFAGGDRAKNLDFGRARHREVWHAWKKRQLLDRPDRIRTQVLYPAAWFEEMRCYMAGLKGIGHEFGIVLERAADPTPYDPLDRASLAAAHETLPDCDLVFAFVPTRGEPGFAMEINPYNTLKKCLFDRKIPSQMITYDTARKAARQQSFFGGVAQNVVLSIVSKLGYTPWQIAEMPGTADAFIGLDIGRQDERGTAVTVAAACIVGDRGALLSWTSRRLAGGETIGDPDLRVMLGDLIEAFGKSSNSRPLRHLVVHRDGTFKDRELEIVRALEKNWKRNGLDRLDLVEIVKDTTVRAARWNGQRYTNPDRGFGWEHAPDEAIVLTTGKGQVKVGSNAAPQPLLVRRRSGETDLLTLAEQVYWLSEMHVGSSQVVRLPVTTYFPDCIAEVTLKGLLPAAVRGQSRPWFL